MKFSIPESRHSFIEPPPSQRVAMVCTECGCHCTAKKGGLRLEAPRRCPECGRRSLVESPLVSY